MLTSAQEVLLWELLRHKLWFIDVHDKLIPLDDNNNEDGPLKAELGGHELI